MPMAAVGLPGVVYGSGLADLASAVEGGTLHSQRGCCGASPKGAYRQRK